VVISGKIFYILFPYKKTKLNTLIGTYECKVDAKGRMLIPAPFKKQLADSLEDFVLKRSVFSIV
jgi:MraZ protein